MIKKKVIVQTKLGLHARPAGLFSKNAYKLSSKISLIKGENKCDAKSILGVLSLCVKCGDEIEIECDGPDEKNDLEILVNLIESGAL